MLDLPQAVAAGYGTEVSAAAADSGVTLAFKAICTEETKRANNYEAVGQVKARAEVVLSTEDAERLRDILNQLLS